MGGKLRFSLDGALPRWTQIALLVVAGLIPTVYVLKHYDARTHFESLIQFGVRKEVHHLGDPHYLPEVKALNPPMESVAGYDGKYYAQLAVKPLLNDPDLKEAMDHPAYRARRILLPALAYVLGLGRPGLVLQAYALLNLGFWFLLLFGMVRWLKAESARDYLCIFAAVFTTGSMISVQRALVDLPASTLLFYTAALGSAGATGLLAMALLARETSLVYLVRFAWPRPQGAREWMMLAGRAVVIVSPLALWSLYVEHVFGNGLENTHAFTWPFMGWAEYMRLSWSKFHNMTWQAVNAPPFLSLGETLHRPGHAWKRAWEVAAAYLADTRVQEWRVFELLAPLSLLVQVCYFAIWRSPQSAYWRLGVVFAVMLVFMTTSEEEIAYCRVVIPMTIAFNIGLMRMRGRTFAFNFIAGNIGLMWGLRDTLAYCLFK